MGERRNQTRRFVGNENGNGGDGGGDACGMSWVAICHGIMEGEGYHTK